MKQQLRIMLLILAMIAGGASSELHAMDGVSYVDNDGTVKTRDDVTDLANAGDFRNLAPGWYVVTEANGFVTIYIQVRAPKPNESGDLHIIIPNGMSMDLTESGIIITNDYGNVYFHAENEYMPGTLTAKPSSPDHAISANCDITFNGLNVEAENTNNGSGIGISSEGNITVNSGSITAIGESFGIVCKGTFTMNGGTVSATSPNLAIKADKGIVFNGGNLTANGTDEGFGILGNVTLKWTRPDDSFTASRFVYFTSITIADGYKFIDNENKIYSGSYHGNDFPNGLTLTPNLPASVTSLDTDGNVVKKKYLTFDDAFNAAKTAYVPGNGSDVAEFIPTVTLHDDIDDITEGYTIGDGSTTKKMTLDLNGHDLSGNGEGCLFTVNNNAVLSVVDNSGEDVEKGTVSYNNETAQAAIKVEIGGTLKTKSVSFACVLGDAIYNAGTAEIDGGTLTGLTGIYCKGSTTVTRTTISGSYYGIDVTGGTMTIGSGVSISGYEGSGIYNSEGTLTFKAIPALTKAADATCPDIFMESGSEITFAEGTYVVPERPITVLSYNNVPYTFTEGYSTFVKSGENVIDPADIFIPYNVHEGLRVCMDGDGAEARIVEASAEVVTLLDDEDNSTSIVRNKFANVTLSGRTLALDGTWNTLCLPFDVYDFEAIDDDDKYLFPLVGATVKELDIDGTYDENGDPAVDGPYKTGLDTQTGELRLYFREVRRIEAGKPYIVKWDAGVDASLTNPVFRNVILKDDIKPMTFPGGTFVGQFSPFEINDGTASEGFDSNVNNIDEILFLATKDGSTVLGYSQSPRFLKSCRAHFYVPAGQGVSAVRSINLNFGDDGEATGIVAQPTLNSQFSVLNSGAWYSMDGRKLSGEPKAKGLYIHNGKKMIIK